MSQVIGLEEYISIIERLLGGKISADEFEAQYLTLFKNDSGNLSESQFSILNQLFTDVDAYCSDPELRDEEDLSEVELRESAESALAKLGGLDRSDSP